MSVEDVIKVNNLAKELLDQKMAETREEAVEQAQQMLRKNIAGSESPKQEPEESAISNDSLEKLKNMIERTKDSVEKQFSGYKNALIALEKEINELKKQVNDLSVRGESKAAKDMGIEDTKVEEAAKPKQQKLKEKKQEPHPKGGDVDAEEVSVEKMFYCGNK